MKSKKRNIGQEILEAIEGIKAGKGKRNPSGVALALLTIAAARPDVIR